MSTTVTFQQQASIIHGLEDYICEQLLDGAGLDDIQHLLEALRKEKDRQEHMTNPA